MSDSSESRRRGRPIGSVSSVLRDDRKLGIHHFAFVRSGLLGLNLRSAHERYLAWSDTCTDLRHIEHRYAELLAEIRSSCLQLGSSLPVGHAAHRALAALQQGPRISTKRLPTLDEWVDAEGLDRDFFGEAELLAEYNSAHGIDNVEAAVAAEEAGWQEEGGNAVKALNLAEQMLAARPAQKDGVALWFAPPVAHRLRAAGLECLQDVASMVSVRGRRWWRCSGIGERRGARIVQWLVSQQDALAIDIRRSAYELIARKDEISEVRDDIIAAPRFAVVPVNRLSIPAHLSGVDGVFRFKGPNTLGAATDAQAVELWLQRFRERPTTLRNYRKEVERFLLWCLLVLRKPLSSVTSPDCQAYRGFLQAVPATWVNVIPVARTDAMWRPFRGQLSSASQKQALVIVQGLFEGLVATGYLTANPMRSLMKSFNLPPGRVQVQRSFSASEVRHIREMVQREPSAPHRRRLDAMLELLLATGVRLDELANATHDSLHQVEVDGELEPAWVVTVIGKRRKQREVPVPDSVVELLKAHATDHEVTPGGLRPLIAALGPGPGGNGEAGAQLSASGLYALLKRFLLRCAKSGESFGLDSERLKASSTHWLRRTFGRRAAVAGVPLQVIGQAMGHASLTTTSVYLTQERSQMIRELRRVGP